MRTLARLSRGLAAITSLCTVAACAKPYYAAYGATCEGLKDSEMRLLIRKMADNVGGELGVTPKVTLDRPDSFVETLDLPLAPGSAEWRPGSSGQVIFSRSSYHPQYQTIAIVISGQRANTEELMARARGLVEANLKASPCPQWRLDTQQSWLSY